MEASSSFSPLMAAPNHTNSQWVLSLGVVYESTQDFDLLLSHQNPLHIISSIACVQYARLYSTCCWLATSQAWRHFVITPLNMDRRRIWMVGIKQSGLLRRHWQSPRMQRCYARITQSLMLMQLLKQPSRPWNSGIMFVSRFYLPSKLNYQQYRCDPNDGDIWQVTSNGWLEWWRGCASVKFRPFAVALWF